MQNIEESGKIKTFFGRFQNQENMSNSKNHNVNTRQKYDYDIESYDDGNYFTGLIYKVNKAPICCNMNAITKNCNNIVRTNSSASYGIELDGKYLQTNYCSAPVVLINNNQLCLPSCDAKLDSESLPKYLKDVEYSAPVFVVINNANNSVEPKRSCALCYHGNNFLTNNKKGIDSCEHSSTTYGISDIKTDSSFATCNQGIPKPNQDANIFVTSNETPKDTKSKNTNENQMDSVLTETDTETNQETVTSQITDITDNSSTNTCSTFNTTLPETLLKFKKYVVITNSNISITPRSKKAVNRRSKSLPTLSNTISIEISMEEKLNYVSQDRNTNSASEIPSQNSKLISAGYISVDSSDDSKSVSLEPDEITASNSVDEPEDKTPNNSDKDDLENANSSENDITNYNAVKNTSKKSNTAHKSTNKTTSKTVKTTTKTSKTPVKTLKTTDKTSRTKSTAKTMNKKSTNSNLITKGQSDIAFESLCRESDINASTKSTIICNNQIDKPTKDKKTITQQRPSDVNFESVLNRDVNDVANLNEHDIEIKNYNAVDHSEEVLDNSNSVNEYEYEYTNLKVDDDNSRTSGVIMDKEETNAGATTEEESQQSNDILEEDISESYAQMGADLKSFSDENKLTNVNAVVDNLHDSKVSPYADVLKYALETFIYLKSVQNINTRAESSNKETDTIPTLRYTIQNARQQYRVKEPIYYDGYKTTYSLPATEQFIVPLHNDTLESIMENTALIRSVALKNKTVIEIPRKILNRPTSFNSKVKYIIIIMRAPVDCCIKTTDKELRKRFGWFNLRRKYDPINCKATLFCSEDTPDNTNLSFSAQRTGSVQSHFGVFDLPTLKHVSHRRKATDRDVAPTQGGAIVIRDSSSRDQPSKRNYMCNTLFYDYRGKPCSTPASRYAKISLDNFEINKPTSQVHKKKYSDLDFVYPNDNDFQLD